MRIITTLVVAAATLSTPSSSSSPTSTTTATTTDKATATNTTAAATTTITKQHHHRSSSNTPDPIGPMQHPPSPPTCLKWAQVPDNDHDGCATISEVNCLAPEAFLRLNPWLGGDCGRIRAGSWYCVGVAGSPVCATVTVTVVPLPLSRVPRTAGSWSG